MIYSPWNGSLCKAKGTTQTRLHAIYAKLLGVMKNNTLLLQPCVHGILSLDLLLQLHETICASIVKIIMGGEK